MGVFRCLKSKVTTNYTTGTDLGSSATTTWTLPNTPIVAGTLSGTIYDGAVAIQTFEVDIDGEFTFAEITESSPTATEGELNLGTGVITLTWSTSPGPNHGVVSYQGLPVYKNVTMSKFGVSCPPPFNPLCNPNSSAYVAAVTVCGQALA